MARKQNGEAAMNGDRGGSCCVKKEDRDGWWIPKRILELRMC